MLEICALPSDPDVFLALDFAFAANRAYNTAEAAAKSVADMNSGKSFPLVEKNDPRTITQLQELQEMELSIWKARVEAAGAILGPRAVGYNNRELFANAMWLMQSFGVIADRTFASNQRSTIS